MRFKLGLGFLDINPRCTANEISISFDKYNSCIKINAQSLLSTSSDTPGRANNTLRMNSNACTMDI